MTHRIVAAKILRWLRGGPTEQPLKLPVGPTEEAAVEARRLTENLQPYLDEPDPLAALMSDLWNKRNE